MLPNTIFSRRFLLILPLFLIYHSGAVKTGVTTKQLSFSKKACDKARRGDANADCSVVNFKMDERLLTADRTEPLFFLVQEVPKNAVDVTPVDLPGTVTSSNPASWGSKLVAKSVGTFPGAGTLPDVLGTKLVAITNNYVALPAGATDRVRKVTIGVVEYGVNSIASNGDFNGNAVLFQAFTGGGLPTAADWSNLIVEFTDNSVLPVPKPKSQKKIPWSSLPSGGSGNTVGLAASQVTSFQVPILAQTTLSVTTANQPVVHNITAFTGAGIANKITQSSVSNIGRITIADAGYVNIVVEDDIQVVSSTAGGSGNTGEFVLFLTQYSSTGTDIRSWLWEHPIEDPITVPINMPAFIVTGLTPVNAGDYFTLNFAFNATNAVNLNFSLPSDNPGLDERVEVIYFEQLSTPGPRGPPGPAGQDGADGTTETATSIKTKLETLQDDARLDASAIKNLPEGGSGDLIALDSTPTDLTEYKHGQILPINTPSPGKFIEVSGADSTERHSFQMTSGADANNVADNAKIVGSTLNFGYSSFGDIFGSLRTADGGQNLTPATTPVMRVELEQTITRVATSQLSEESTWDLTVLIRKVSLTSAPNNLWIRFYSGPPANNNQIDTIQLQLGADNINHDYHTYIEASGEDPEGAGEDLDDIAYFNLFTANPSTGDQTSNPVNLHNTKSTSDFNPADTGATIVTKLSGLSGNARLPASAVRDLPTSGTGTNYDADNADISKPLKFAVQETTPANTQVNLIEDTVNNDNFLASINNEGITEPSPFSNIFYWKPIFFIPDLQQRWTIRFANAPSKTPTHIVINGREFPIVSSSSRTPTYRTTNPVTVAGFFPTSSNLTFRVNVKFSDNTFAITETLETKTQKVLTNSGLFDFLGHEGTFIHTPRRVKTLPSETTNPLDGEIVWVESDYSQSAGVNITPQSFAGTELDPLTDPDAAAGIGSAGWYNKADAGYQFGEIHPALPDNFVLISNTRVYVKRNTLTNLSKIHYGYTGNSLPLTRVPQPAGTKLNNNPAYANSLPDVDYYTITGTLSTVETARWDNVRFETTTEGTFIPASTTITKGLYEFKNRDWSRAGFYAPPAQPDKNLTFQVEEKRPGTRQDQNIALTASGSTFTKSAPFASSPDILRLTYNNSSTDTDTYQRYTVFISLDNFQDSDAPALLKLGSTNYSLSYFETDAGQAVYRSQVVATADRVTTAGTINGVNIQRADNSWVGQTGEKTVLKTVDKTALQAVANAATGVHIPPTNPHEGMRIIMLNDYTVRGGAVLSAAESSGTSSTSVNINGLFTGYEIDSRYDNGATGGDLGSLDPTNTNFQGLLSFSNAHSAGSQANKTMFISVNGNTYAPSKVWINSVQYSVGSAVNRDYFPLTGLNGSFLKAGKQYYVNAETSAGAKLYPDVQLKAGSFYIWNGLFWQLEKAGLSSSQVDSRIDNRIPQQFRNDADTSGQYFQPKCFWNGTEAQYTALSPKIEDCVYFRR